MGGVSRLQQIRVILLKLNVLYCLENAFVSLKIVSIHGILLDFWGFVPRTHWGSAPIYSDGGRCPKTICRPVRKGGSGGGLRRLPITKNTKKVQTV